MLQVNNDSGRFGFSTKIGRWLCLEPTPKSRGRYALNITVPLADEQALTAQARAEGATDEDLGIVREDEPKPKRVRVGGRRKPSGSKLDDDLLFTFN